jgi:hypothetical protein
MPFALLLFWTTAQFLRTGSRTWLLRAAAAGALNVAIKPSVVFAVLPVFPLLALVRFRGSRALWQAWGLTAFLAGLVLLQYLYLYQTGANETLYRASGFYGSGNSSIEINPFHVWNHFSNSIVLSLLASTAFPLVALAVYRRKLVEYDLVRYAGALFGASLVIWSVFTETGVREFHANFAWGAIASNYILFMVILIRVWALREARPSRLTTGAVGAAFAAHVAAGAAFLVYYLSNKTYF